MLFYCTRNQFIIPRSQKYPAKRFYNLPSLSGTKHGWWQWCLRVSNPVRRIYYLWFHIELFAWLSLQTIIKLCSLCLALYFSSSDLLKASVFAFLMHPTPQSSNLSSHYLAHSRNLPLSCPSIQLIASLNHQFLYLSLQRLFSLHHVLPSNVIWIVINIM